MKLKRLELYGYKSFASRTVFSFDEGITAIVGPNGSGKSNIADAVRWVMGEQSYTSMRAKTTEDMIFAGSKTRARLGMAEVLLVFDNTSGWLPLEYAEVSVGRRAFRSGENEYLLNGTKVRYRDILDLFGGAGLARSNYTVIGQGMVDAALALRPEARRALFEEAAGITPQLRKREESLQRIAETERNLQRVVDIAQELEPRVRMLRRQAERAHDHAILRQDLRELERIWYGFHWQRLAAQRKRAQLQLREQQSQVEALRSAIRRLEERRLGAEKEMEGLRQELGQISTQHAECEAQRNDLIREIAVYSERLKLYESQQYAISKELETLIAQQDVIQREVEHARGELAELEAALNRNQEELEKTRTAHARADAERRRQADVVAHEQKNANQVDAALAELKARLAQAGERYAELEQAVAQGESGLTVVNQKIAQARSRQQVMAEQEQLLDRELAEIQQRRTVLLQEQQTALEHLKQAEQEHMRKESELETLRSRQSIQARLRQEMPGYHPGVREVLSGNTPLRGLVGTVASLMTVPAEYEDAVEAALGTRLQNIVAERWEDAETAISHLKKTGAGWATFLPLDTINARPPARIKSEPGIIGVACSLVRFEERLRPVFDLLLGSVLVVRDLAAARRLLRTSQGISLFVTLGGETVQPSGALSGGARRNTANLLAQERVWRELPGQIAQAQTEVEAAALQVARAQHNLQEARSSVAQAEQHVQRKRGELEALRNRLAGAGRELRDAESELSWLKARFQKDSAELISLANRISGLGEQQRAKEAEQLLVMERLREATERLANQDDSLRQRLASLETQVAVGLRTVRSQKTLLESHEANLEQLHNQIGQKQGQLSGLQTLLVGQQEGLSRAGTAANELEERIARLIERMAPLQARAQAYNQARQDDERNRVALQERLAAATLEVERTQREIERLSEQQQTIRDEMEGDLGQVFADSEAAQQLSLDLGGSVVQLPGIPSIPDGLEDQIRALKAAIRRGGDVNPDAPAEYAQAQERLEFLRTQERDLREAIAALQKVIKELEQLIEQDLRKTFKEVQKSFSGYFTLLFNGGSAELELTNPDNFSETGIDITARPPGKRAQSLALLSGGERALTAVALLFALLEVNPVPFCFLDEVDAALDEANIFRFRELLQRHAANTQFIVITHNRRTIETARSIYGIAMGEQGVSQVISLKVADEPAAVIASD